MTRGIRFAIGPALLLAILGPGPLSAQGLFHDAAYYATGSDPRDVGAQDLNGDAWPDLAVANRLSGSVSVLLNQGDGTFHAALPYPTGTLPLALALGTLDGDAYPDIVTSNSGANSVSVLLNNGDGSFQAPVHYTVGQEPWGLALADYDGNMTLDVAVVNYNSLSVSILLNDGEGALHPGGGFSVGGAYTKPAWLAAGDLDADEDADLVVVKNYHNLYFHGSYVEIFTNDGAGGFSSAGEIVLGRTATTTLVLDLDDDEDLDLAVSGFVTNSYQLSVLLNDGAGNFTAPVGCSAAADGRACAGDFDADGDPDVAISRQGVGAHGIAIVLGDGSGDFAAPFTVVAGAAAMGIACADMDRDGDGDLAVAASGDNQVAVLMSRADPITAVGEEAGAMPALVPSLAQNHPNPFNPSTTIEYWLPEATQVRLSIHSADGRLIRRLVDGQWRPAGEQRIQWDGTSSAGHRVGSGVYLSTLEVAGRQESRRMLLLK